MKNIPSAILVLLIICLSFSCNKDNDGDEGNPNNTPSDTATFNINGQSSEAAFIITLNQSFGNDSNILSISMPDAISSTANTLIVGISHSNDSPLETITYSYSAICDPTTENCLNLIYAESDNEEEYSMEHPDSEMNLTFHTLELESGGSIIGSFSGTVLRENGDIATITEGEFNTTFP